MKGLRGSLLWCEDLRTLAEDPNEEKRIIISNMMPLFTPLQVKMYSSKS